MRNFIDLHLRAPVKKENLEAMLELAIKLGYKGVGLVHNGQQFNDLKPLTVEKKLDLVSRINIKPMNINELTSSIRRLRKKYEVLAVECRTKKIARQAAKDHRVDILDFPTMVSARSRNLFDRKEAALASDANSAYEINLSELLSLQGVDRARLFSISSREIRNAKRFDVPVIISSGARIPLQMRDPRGLAAVLTMLGSNNEEGLDAVSMNPMNIVKVNRGKLDPNFVFPGVKEV